MIGLACDGAVSAALDHVPGWYCKRQFNYGLGDERIYERHVEGAESKRFEAAEVIRSLIEAILLVPEGGELKIDVRGDLAGILAIALERKKPASRAGSSKAATPCGVSQFQLVAGAGFEPATFRL